MIYIKRPSRPEKLTDVEAEKLTQEYKDDHKIVWNKGYIKDALLEMTHNKCCYCESPLNEQGAYMEIEHFHPKSLYPDEVVKWENLLPICKTCNINKSSYDTKKCNFIDPSEVNPKAYFWTKNYRYVPRNEVAKETLRVLRLNSVDRLMVKRCEISSVLQDKVGSLFQSVTAHVKNPNKLIPDVNELRALLKLVQPTENYSAVISSVLLNDNNYKRAKELIKGNGYWDDSLEKLEKVAKNIAFDEEPVSK